MRGRDVVQPQQQGQGVRVDLGAQPWVRAQGRQLAAEQHGAVLGPAVVQRFLADPVAGQPQHLLLAVPGGQREHAVAALQGFVHAPLGDRRQQHLGVGMAVEAMAQRGQRLAQGMVVVDLAVEGQHPASVGRDHRLVAFRAQVQDRQAPVRQHHPGGRIGPGAAVIGAAMGDGLAHAAAERLERLAPAVFPWRPGAGDSAHRAGLSRAPAARAW